MTTYSGHNPGQLAKRVDNSLCKNSRCCKNLLTQSLGVSRLLALLLAGLLAFSLHTAYRASWIAVKANVAQILLAAAWEQSKVMKRPVKPWPWMDTHPVARLIIDSTEKTLIVLDGTSGEAMAFGPSHIDLPFDQIVTGSTAQSERRATGTATPGSAAGSVSSSVAGLVAIGGHRDTHLHFLKTMQTGDTISLETSNGLLRHFRLESTQIVDSSREEFLIAPQTQGLLMVTCYPFDSLSAGGPLRLVAFAREIITPEPHPLDNIKVSAKN